MEGFSKEAALIKQRRFDGKSNQPTPNGIVNNYLHRAQKDGSGGQNALLKRQLNDQGAGVVSLNGKMIDAPIIDRAKSNRMCEIIEE